MPSSRSWLLAIRLLLIAGLLAGATGSSLAFQEEEKDDLRDRLIGDESDDTEESPGLIDEGEYASPQFGVEVSWTDAWAVGDVNDHIVEHAIGGNFDGSVASDPALGDIVFLVDTESETAVLSLGFAPNLDPFSPDQFLPFVEDPSFLEDNLFLSADAEILMADTTRDTIAVVARDVAPNDEHVIYWMVVTDPRADDFRFWVGLDLYDANEYERILRSMDEDIEVAGQDLFPVFDVDEIIEVIAGDLEPDVEPTEVATEEPSDEPTEVATEEPSDEPAEAPTEVATEEPAEETKVPSLLPLATSVPTEAPAEEATEEPAEVATEEPTETATEEPAEEATEQPTEEATEEPAGEPTEEPTEVATEEPTEEPTEELETIDPGASPEIVPGLLGDGDYVSPQHDVPVTWTGAWIPDPDVDPAIESSTGTGVDGIHLTDAGTESATVYITIEPLAQAFNGPGFLDALTTTRYIETVLGLSPETEVVFTTSGDDAVAVVYHDASADPEFVSILEMRVVDEDTVTFVEVRVPLDALDEDLIASVMSDIQVNGNDALALIEPGEILEPFAAPS